MRAHNGPMSRIVNEAIRRYESRIPNAREAKAADPNYAYQTAVLHRMLEVADMAMEDEDIPAPSRARIIATILYGSPHEADALLRVEQLQQTVNWMKDQTPSVTFPLGEPKR